MILKRTKVKDSHLPISKLTKSYSNQNSVALAKGYRYRSMPCNRESRNIPLHLWSINF